MKKAKSKSFVIQEGRNTPFIPNNDTTTTAADVVNHNMGTSNDYQLNSSTSIKKPSDLLLGVAQEVYIRDAFALLIVFLSFNQIASLVLLISFIVATRSRRFLADCLVFLFVPKETTRTTSIDCINNNANTNVTSYKNKFKAVYFKSWLLILESTLALLLRRYENLVVPLENLALSIVASSLINQPRDCLSVATSCSILYGVSFNLLKKLRSTFGFWQQQHDQPLLESILSSATFNTNGNSNINNINILTKNDNIYSSNQNNNHNNNNNNNNKNNAFNLRLLFSSFKIKIMNGPFCKTNTLNATTSLCWKTFFSGICSHFSTLLPILIYFASFHIVFYQFYTSLEVESRYQHDATHKVKKKGMCDTTADEGLPNNNSTVASGNLMNRKVSETIQNNSNIGCNSSDKSFGPNNTENASTQHITTTSSPSTTTKNTNFISSTTPANAKVFSQLSPTTSNINLVSLNSVNTDEGNISIVANTNNYNTCNSLATSQANLNNGFDNNFTASNSNIGPIHNNNVNNSINGNNISFSSINSTVFAVHNLSNIMATGGTTTTNNNNNNNNDHINTFSGKRDSKDYNDKNSTEFANTGTNNNNNILTNNSTDPHEQSLHPFNSNNVIEIASFTNIVEKSFVQSLKIRTPVEYNSQTIVSEPTMNCGNSRFSETLQLPPVSQGSSSLSPTSTFAKTASGASGNPLSNVSPFITAASSSTSNNNNSDNNNNNFVGVIPFVPMSHNNSSSSITSVTSRGNFPEQQPQTQQLPQYTNNYYQIYLNMDFLSKSQPTDLKELMGIQNMKTFIYSMFKYNINNSIPPLWCSFVTCKIVNLEGKRILKDKTNKSVFNKNEQDEVINDCKSLILSSCCDDDYNKFNWDTDEENLKEIPIDVIVNHVDETWIEFLLITNNNNNNNNNNNSDSSSSSSSSSSNSSANENDIPKKELKQKTNVGINSFNTMDDQELVVLVNGVIWFRVTSSIPKDYNGESVTISGLVPSSSYDIQFVIRKHSTGKDYLISDSIIKTSVLLEDEIDATSTSLNGNSRTSSNGGGKAKKNNKNNGHGSNSSGNNNNGQLKTRELNELDFVTDFSFPSFYHRKFLSPLLTLKHSVLTTNTNLRGEKLKLKKLKKDLGKKLNSMKQEHEFYTKKLKHNDDHEKDDNKRNNSKLDNLNKTIKASTQTILELQDGLDKKTENLTVLQKKFALKQKQVDEVKLKNKTLVEKFGMELFDLRKILNKKKTVLNQLQSKEAKLQKINSKLLNNLEIFSEVNQALYSKVHELNVLFLDNTYNQHVYQVNELELKIKGLEQDLVRMENENANMTELTRRMIQV
ncbi:Nnf2p SCDLUD_002354 [Saccharomycodes ludwigii]|uniref:Nnf2p n=1 Tax=Saccharomycodes ludwigii TaxID=36035 RepID=UPI001E88DFF9|nr:hypothetical protein SCDLUD_002354 [Saccharomycodes ludwigii]KAH3900895.1 hypothetical protein SCDLUD_002354 [Saccharomycodes ludwigii]